jgi:uncharacterized membrane protein
VSVIVLFCVVGIWASRPGGPKNVTTSYTISPKQRTNFDYDIQSYIIGYTISCSAPCNIFVFNTTQYANFDASNAYYPYFTALQVKDSNFMMNTTISVVDWITVVMQNPSASTTLTVTGSFYYTTDVDIDWGLAYGLAISIPIAGILMIYICVFCNSIYLFIYEQVWKPVSRSD